MNRRQLMKLSVGAGLCLMMTLAAAQAWAGGGPEGVLVVVNGDSPLSLRMANEYMALRRIPANHLCLLSNVPAAPVIDVQAFRDRIWAPIRAWLEAHDPHQRIDVIAYSGDFPYGVDFVGDLAPPYDAGVSPIASLTGMTYLARRVESKDARGYLNLQVNRYFRRYSGLGGPAVGRKVSTAANQAYQEATTALQAKQYPQAAAAFERMLAEIPEHFQSWYNLACCYGLMAKPDDAIRALTKAVEHGWTDAGHTAGDTDLTCVRELPAFQDLLKKMQQAKAREAGRVFEVQAARAFGARHAWTAEGDIAPDLAGNEVDRYWLAVSLAYTGERGTSLPESMSYLRSAIGSDGTQPQGTVYFLINDDIRARTREPLFATAAAALRQRGRQAAILSKADAGQTGVLPVQKQDVIGAVVGIAGFTWADAKSRLLPGALAEHLTSFGAMYNTGSQTKITEFFRAGAAGSSGAVAEPYALQDKFPTPHLHVFYADGCSLAESFYQSVRGPYQLLVVGDPLARPFAHFAKVELATPATQTPWSGTVEVRAKITPATDRPIAQVELWVDGNFLAQATPDAALSWDTTLSEDGAHEVRLVAVDATPIATRSDTVVRVTVANSKSTVTVAPIKGPVVCGEPLSLAGVAGGAREVRVFCGDREVAVAPVKGGAWKCPVPTESLGVGPITLQVRATLNQGGCVRSPLLDVQVEPPARRKPAKSPTKTQEGLRAVVTDTGGKTQEVRLTALGGPGVAQVAKQLEGKLGAGAKQVEIQGEFEVGGTGWFELQLRAQGAIQVEIDGKPALVQERCTADRMTCAAVSLDAGWHGLRVVYTPDAAIDLSALLGGEQAVAPLAGKQLRCEAREEPKGKDKDKGKGKGGK